MDIDGDFLERKNCAARVEWFVDHFYIFILLFCPTCLFLFSCPTQNTNIVKIRHSNLTILIFCLSILWAIHTIYHQNTIYSDYLVHLEPLTEQLNIYTVIRQISFLGISRRSLRGSYLLFRKFNVISFRYVLRLQLTIQTYKDICDPDY
jgi:hypothetical protein